MNKQRGFTLIELLVVIAIIGILASVVLVNLNTARQRARNAQRISDIDQLKLALQLYYDDNGTYPTDAEGLAILDDAPNAYVPRVPTAPAGAAFGYTYDFISAADYCLGAYLETGGTVPGNDVACDPDGAGAFDQAAALAYTVKP